MLKRVLSEHSHHSCVCFFFLFSVCVRQEVPSRAADGCTVEFDNKGKGSRRLVFYLGSPEETPLFLGLLGVNYT